MPSLFCFNHSGPQNPHATTFADWWHPPRMPKFQCLETLPLKLILHWKQNQKMCLESGRSTVMLPQKKSYIWSCQQSSRRKQSTLISGIWLQHGGCFGPCQWRWRSTCNGFFQEFHCETDIETLLHSSCKFWIGNFGSCGWTNWKKQLLFMTDYSDLLILYCDHLLHTYLYI